MSDNVDMHAPSIVRVLEGTKGVTPMERNPIANDARQARQKRRMGKDAACALCGITTPEALLRVDRSLLEGHHVVGKAFDDALTIPVCRNCHAILTEGQQRRGCTFRSQRTVPECIVAMLTHLIAFFHDLGDLLTVWREKIIAFVQGLDTDYPDWRGKDWATV